MAKQVTIQSGKCFPTLKAAKDHYCALRESIELGSALPEPERSNVLDIYKRYCDKTGWPPIDAVNVTTQWDNKQRPGGTYAQTKAFAVVTASGESDTFSMDKALTAIAE